MAILVFIRRLLLAPKLEKLEPSISTVPSVFSYSPKTILLHHKLKQFLETSQFN